MSPGERSPRHLWLAYALLSAPHLLFDADNAEALFQQHSLMFLSKSIQSDESSCLSGRHLQLTEQARKLFSVFKSLGTLSKGAGAAMEEISANEAGLPEVARRCKGCSGSEEIFCNPSIFEPFLVWVSSLTGGIVLNTVSQTETVTIAFARASTTEGLADFLAFFSILYIARKHILIILFV
jgi:hypothetical protein